jgi:hypothetical protein
VSINILYILQHGSRAWLSESIHAAHLYIYINFNRLWSQIRCGTAKLIYKEGSIKVFSEELWMVPEDHLMLIQRQRL